MSDQITHSYPVLGLTCGHCADAVTNEISHLAGVAHVTVDVVADGIWTKTPRLERGRDGRTRSASIPGGSISRPSTAFVTTNSPGFAPGGDREPQGRATRPPYTGWLRADFGKCSLVGLHADKNGH